MKLLLQAFFIIAIFSVFSCQENNSSTEKLSPKMEQTILEITSKEIEDERIRREENEKDSLLFQQLITEAIDTTKNLIKQNNNKPFLKEYESELEYRNEKVRVKVEGGYFFSKENLYVIIRERIDLGTLVNLYYVPSNFEENDELVQVVSSSPFNFIYQSDTVKDINGDNKKDFVIYGITASSAYTREIYDVYLFQTETKFTEQYHFLNPTFYPKEKVIRGIEYGYDAPLYKYKWNGLKVDTLEYIHKNLEDSTKATYWKTKNWTGDYNLRNIKKTKLNSIPKEYHSIDNFDVFEANNSH